MTQYPTILPVVIIILTCLGFSAFCAGMEMTFVASNKLKLEIQKKRSRTFNHIISVFLKEPGQYIATILVGNNITLVIYSLQMTVLLNLLLGARAATGWAILLQTLISTLIIILIGEYVPKTFMRGNPNMFMKAFAVPIYIVYIILYPIARFSIWVSVTLMRLAGLKINPGNNIRKFDRIELEYLVDEAAGNRHAEPENEIKLFRNAMDFADLRVRDCMVPRVDIESVDITDTIGHITERFMKTNYSRIMVGDGSIDNLIGYVNSKSLFTNPQSVNQALNDVDFVPESLPAQNLLTMLIRNNRTMAVVIDEYGGTAGIVSMEDVLEEIFGEIEDEYDSQDMMEKVYRKGDYLFSGRLEVDYLNEKYGLGIPESNEYDTLAGYVIYYHSRIPERGDVIKIGDKQIEVLKVDNSKLELMRLTVD